MDGTIPPNRLALIGFMASGKSTVGPIVARLLGWEFIDLDQEIERRTRASIAEIFRAKGEEAFRGMETECLLALVQRKRLVIATGGGAPMRDENLAFFRDACTAVFFLHVPLREALTRSGDGGSRPLLAGDADKVARLYRSRLGRYRLLGREIQTSGRSPMEVAAEIAGAVGPQIGAS